MKECISCNKPSNEGVRFPCPQCGANIFRCGKCRNLSIEYKCPECGHIGP